MMPNTLTVQKTINVSSEKIYNAFSKASELSKWFTTDHKLSFRTGGKYKNGDGDEGRYLEIKPNMSIRFTWENKLHCPGTEVRVEFNKLGRNKTKVVLTHSKLESPAHVKDMQTGWSWALACLKSYLETGNRIMFEDWYKKTHA